MSLAQWQRPVMATVARLAVGTPLSSRLVLSLRSAVVPSTTVGVFPGLDIAGKRHASVKAQGQYKLKPKRTIPKKLGAKKTSGQYVIPGNMIWKQRGTIWWPGVNTHMGRDHTIHASEAGYVQFYRDPQLHPKRKFIGVTFNKDDKLPYAHNAPRRRRLNMVAMPRVEKEPEPELSRSGLPMKVTQVAAFRRNPKEHRPPPRILRLRDDYSYREDNWALGQVNRGLKQDRPPPGTGRSHSFRRARLKRVREIEATEKGKRRKKTQKLKAWKERKADRKKAGGAGVGPDTAPSATARQRKKNAKRA